MNKKRFYRTQRDLAAAVNEVIDGYWEDKIDDEELERDYSGST